jgi:serine/threonine protein kinase
MEIPFEEITLGKQISEGGYGIIYMATWRKSTVAVKLFKIDQENDNSIRDFISECHAMEALRHPNIVMFLGACTKPPHFAIVLEYCEEGTLWSHLQKTSGDISWEERRRLALDVARGMNYLH